ncbi:MAG: hypothetical protein EOM62_18375 [Bacteroidia bacterium]|nr:hypothetical protein [Bacteroidia bacterium]
MNCLPCFCFFSTPFPPAGGVGGFLGVGNGNGNGNGDGDGDGDGDGVLHSVYVSYSLRILVVSYKDSCELLESS